MKMILRTNNFVSRTNTSIVLDQSCCLSLNFTFYFAWIESVIDLYSKGRGQKNMCTHRSTGVAMKVKYTAHLFRGMKCVADLHWMLGMK